MKNNRGFTVIELLTSFTLTMVIVVFLFEILIQLKDLYYEAEVKTEVLYNKSMLIEKIRNDLDEKELINVNCGDNTCDFTFANNTTSSLTINKNENIIIYGDKKIKFPTEINFTNYEITSCDMENGKPKNDIGLLEGTIAKNCYFTIKIDIESKKLSDEYDINVVYPYHYEPGFVSGNLTSDVDSANTFTKFHYTGDMQTFTAPKAGTYKIELVGASGGNNGSKKGGKGAYTTGEIYLEANENLNVYVGGAGSKTAAGVANSSAGGYNGGGDGSSDSGYAGGGGGATDIRFGGNDLNNRIMVAAGGSGAGNGTNPGKGTAGGGLIAPNSNHSNGPKGATQTSGGGFGIGANAQGLGSGGGGGYYGGAGGIEVSGTGTSGTGGTSFISGHLGSNAIISDNSINPSNQEIHYSKEFFYNTAIYDGDHTPKFDGNRVLNDDTSDEFYERLPDGVNSSGSAGDGYAVITYLGSHIPEEASKKSSIKANYEQDNLVLWLDGHDNVGAGIHSYNSESWKNIMATNGMSLSNPIWESDGIKLQSGSITLSELGTSFTMSTIFTLNSFPSTEANIFEGKLGIYVNSSGYAGFVSGNDKVLFDYQIPLNVKNYLTISTSGTEIKLYVNGELADTKNYTTTEGNNVSLNLNSQLTGTLHKIMIYNQKLEDNGISNIYNEDKKRYDNYVTLNNKALEYSFFSNTKDANNNVIGRYDLSDGKVSDISENTGDNDGEIVGANTITDNGLVLGANDYIKIPGNINYRYTMFLVVSRSGANLGNNPILIGGDTNTYPKLLIDSNYYYFNATSFNRNYPSGNNKEYIALVYDGSNVTLYINGTQAGQISTTTNPMSQNNVYIGKNFIGKIHKYALYDRAFMPKEIRKIYENDYSQFKA